MVPCLGWPFAEKVGSGLVSALFYVSAYRLIGLAWQLLDNRAEVNWQGSFCLQHGFGGRTALQVAPEGGN